MRQVISRNIMQTFSFIINDVYVNQITFIIELQTMAYANEEILFC